MERKKFQGVCLVATEGHRWMSYYDKFPPDVRKRLQSSTFNLCAACVTERIIEWDHHGLHTRITEMETMLKESQLP